MIEHHLSWAVLWWRAKYPESVIRGYQLNLQNALNTRLPNPILNFCYKLTSGRKVIYTYKILAFYYSSLHLFKVKGCNSICVLFRA